MNSKENERTNINIISKYRGVLMGIAIISVILFHFTDDCRRGNYNYDGLIRMYNYIISSTGVELFLLLSGFGLYYSFKRNGNIRSFYKRRFTRIILPYIFVAVPAWIWRDLVLANKGILSFLKDFFFITFFTDGISWFWYILISIICYLIFPYIFDIFDSAKDRITAEFRMFSVFTFFMASAIWLEIYCTSFFGKVNIMLLRFPAFFLGVLIGHAAYNNEKFPKETIIFIILSFLLLPLRKVDRVIVVRFVLASFNLSVALIFTFILDRIKNQKIQNFIVKPLEVIGKYSLELYLCHITIRSVMWDIGYKTYRIRYELIMVLLTVVASIILKRVVNLIISKIEKYCY